MNYWEMIKSALAALRSNLLRTGLTMLGIVIGIASVIIIVSLGQGASSSITSQVAALGSGLIFVSPGSMRSLSLDAGVIDTLTYADAQALADAKNIAGLNAASASISRAERVTADGEYSDATVQGISDGYQIVQTVAVSRGRFISAEDELGLARVAVLGPTVAADLFGAGADPIGRTVSISSKLFRVVGVTEAKGTNGFFDPDKIVYVPVTTAMKVLFGQHYVNAIYATAGDASQVEILMGKITQFLLDRHRITDPGLADFSVNSSKQALSILGSVTSTLVLMLAGIAGISLLVGGIGIMNIMLVTVTERTREIGLLKAIGARRRDILGQFLIESSVLTILGGLIGIAAGVLATYLLADVIGVPFVLQAYSILLAVGVSAAVGIVFGFYPARRAARLNPIEALRYE